MYPNKVEKVEIFYGPLGQVFVPDYKDGKKMYSPLSRGRIGFASWEFSAPSMCNPIVTRGVILAAAARHGVSDLYPYILLNTSEK